MAYGFWHKLVVHYRAFSMRRHPTLTENAVCDVLQNYGIRYSEQYVIYPYIVDFYLPRYKAIIEVDGKVHNDTGVYDDRRSEYLTRKGYTLYRIEASYSHRKLTADALTIIKEIAHT